MPDVAKATNLYLGRGKLYVDELDVNEASTGEEFAGNVTAFEIDAPEDTKEQMRDWTQSSAPLLDEVTTERKAKFRFTGVELTAAMLARFSMGTKSTLAQTASSASNEAVTARLDKWVKLSKRKVLLTPTPPVVTNTAGAVTYVLGTDYELDLETGRIKALSTGAITEAQVLHVDYSWDVVSYPKIDAMNKTSLKCAIRFIANPARGKEFEVFIPKASLTPTGNLPFIGSTYAQFTLEGEMISDGVTALYELFDRT
jgi:hypothetical protein